MPNSLHVAAAKPDGFQQVRELVEAGANVNEVDPESKVTPVYYAAEFGSLESFVYLLERSDLNCDQGSIINCGCGNPDIRVPQYILAPENAIHAKCKDGTSELAIAAARGDIEMVSQLINANPERLNEKNNNNESIAKFAFYNNQLAVIEFLMTHHAYDALPIDEQIAIKKYAARTAVDLLPSSGDSAVTLSLLEKALVHYLEVQKVTGLEVVNLIELNNKLGNYHQNHQNADKANLYFGAAASYCLDEFECTADEVNRKTALENINLINTSVQEHRLALIEKYRVIQISCEAIREKNATDYNYLADASTALAVEYDALGKHLDSVKCLKNAIKYKRLSADSNWCDVLFLESQLKILYKNNPLLASTENWDLECRDVPADGNCFFHALVDQLALHNVARYADLDATTLRQMAVKHVRQYESFYASFFDSKKSFDQFINTIECIGSSVDQHAVKLIARMLNVTLVIVPDNQDMPLNICKQVNPIATLYLGRQFNNHYQSLILRPDLMEEKSLSAIINKEPFDQFNLQKKEVESNQKKHAADLHQLLLSPKRQKIESGSVMSPVVSPASQTFFAKKGGVDTHLQMPISASPLSLDAERSFLQMS